LIDGNPSFVEIHARVPSWGNPWGGSSPPFGDILPVRGLALSRDPLYIAKLLFAGQRLLQTAAETMDRRTRA